MTLPKLALIGLAAQGGAVAALDEFARALQDDVAAIFGAEGSASSPTAAALRDAGLPPDAPVPVLQATPDAVFAALAGARRLLAAGQAEVAVIAAEDGAVAVCDAALAQARGWRTYAVLENLTLTAASLTAPETSAYLDLCACDEPACAALRRAYHAPGAERACALGASPGEMISLLKAALALHCRVLPAHPGLAAPAAWRDTPFYADAAPRPWLQSAAHPRRAAIHTGNGTQLTLIESRLWPVSDRATTPHNRLQPISNHLLLPLSAANQEGLLAQLREARAAIAAAVAAAGTWAEVRRLARARALAWADAGLTLALVAESHAQLLREMDFAAAGVVEAFRTGRPWQTPRGSYFTPQPLGRDGRVAFVYPGAFNAYPDLGRDLFRLFPALHADFAHVTTDAAGTLGALYPRSLAPLDPAERRTYEQALAAHPEALIEAGAGFAVLYTRILRDYFGVQPRAALGYSLGEASMLWAAGVWADADAYLRAWRESALFKTRLVGPKDAVREAWGLAPADGADCWRTYLLKAPLPAIQAQVDAEPRVALTLLNAPGEGVIAGDPAGCRRVIAALDCHALPAPYDAVLHADVLRSEAARFRELYTHPIAQRPAVAFYSAADYAPLRLDSAAVADALARMTCAPVDFPRLVQRVYADGARVFVELGPQRTCTRWIGKILGEQPHAALAIDKKGASAAQSLFGLLAALLSHGVPLDLARLYGEEPTATEVTENPEGKKPLLTEAQLVAFATGSPSECFGPAYALFEHRRLPRIPNGDLRLISRVLSIDGAPGDIRPGAALVGEYDIPAAAWFYGQNGHAGALPYAVLMEIALQPCGVLTAYLGSALLAPESDFYFRNLDGTGQLRALPDLRGRTIVSQARLLSSTALRGVILQKFAFELACAGQTFYTGEASFGFFERKALENQAGLDAAPTPPWYRREGVTLQPRICLKRGPLDLLDAVQLSTQGGAHGQGYIHGRMTVNPQAWFFGCHFYQDPVMPGSLGVQAIHQALGLYAEQMGARGPLTPLTEHVTRWKYRGQITPQDHEVQVEVSLREVVEGRDGFTLRGDAGVWNGDRRIYAVEDVGVSVKRETSGGFDV